MESREPVISSAALDTLRKMFRTLYDAVAGGANDKRLLQLITRCEKAANSFTVLEVDERMDLTDTKREQRHGQKNR